jgi:hypothetical protein
MLAMPPPMLWYPIHAIAVIVAPAPAPASPKHATVDSVGYAPLVFAMTSGELPVAWYIQSSMAYLERWYMEKETVRTRVMLSSGDQTPARVISKTNKQKRRITRTTPEPMEALASVCVADAVAEGVEFVASKR